MASNVQICAVKGCKAKLLDGYRMVLMMGPQGYRRYPICRKCAEKMGLDAAKPGGRQRQMVSVRHGERNA